MKVMRQQVRQLRKWSLIVCLMTEAGMLAIAMGMTDTLIGIFNSEQNAQLLAIAHTGLRLYFLGFLFARINGVWLSFLASEIITFGVMRICNKI